MTTEHEVQSLGASRLLVLAGRTAAAEWIHRLRRGTASDDWQADMLAMLRGRLAGVAAYVPDGVAPIAMRLDHLDARFTAWRSLTSGIRSNAAQRRNAGDLLTAAVEALEVDLEVTQAWLRTEYTVRARDARETVPTLW